DTWTPTSTVNAPSARYHHTAVWTGSVMLVWGGWTDSPPADLNTGGRYDPSSDTWTPTSTLSAPAARRDHSAVWTGARMIVWGGGSGFCCQPDLGTGGQYDPVTNTWTPTAAMNAPAARRNHTSIWTGSLMVVWV